MGNNMNNKSYKNNETTDEIATIDECSEKILMLYRKSYGDIRSKIDIHIRSLTNGGNIISGHDADDILQLMVIKLIDPQIDPRRRRRWNKKKCTNFNKFFISGCYSIVNNLYKRIHKNDFNYQPVNNEDKREDQNGETEFEIETDFNESGNEDGVYFNGFDIENNFKVCRKIYNDYILNSNDDGVLSEEETEQIIKSIQSELINRNDQVDLIVFKALIEEDADENSKDRNIALKHNIPIKEVRNAKKRVRRLTKNIYVKYKNERKKG